MVALGTVLVTVCALIAAVCGVLVRNVYAAALVLAVVLLAAFLILPAVSTVRYAFTDYNILRPDKIKFCGLDNFVELFGDRDFKKSLVNTIYFTVVVVPFQCILALLLAMLISSRRKGVSIFRAAISAPTSHPWWWLPSSGACCTIPTPAQAF